MECEDGTHRWVGFQPALRQPHYCPAIAEGKQSDPPVCILDYSLIKTSNRTDLSLRMLPVKYCLNSGLYAWHLKYLLARLSPLVDLFQNASVKTPYRRVSHSLGGAEENAVNIDKSTVCVVLQMFSYIPTPGLGGVENISRLIFFVCMD